MTVKRIIVTGANGQLGQSLKDLIEGDPEISAVYADIEDFDITDTDSTESFLGNHPFDVIVNCAAYTAVDRAETERELAEKINGEGPAVIGSLAKKFGGKVIHISTDYVFDGNHNTPYRENDPVNPQTVYGSSKLHGEAKLLDAAPDSIIIRTAWLYSPYGKNFFLTMRNKAMANENVRVVADQKGTPTFAGDLAAAIIKIIKSETWHPGIYHFTNEGETTWYEFASEIYRLTGAETEKVAPIATGEYPAVAQRPAYSVLDKSKIKQTYKIDIPDWQSRLSALIHNGNK